MYNLFLSIAQLITAVKVSWTPSSFSANSALYHQEWFGADCVIVLEWPRQSRDLNPNEHVWREMKIAVHWFVSMNRPDRSLSGSVETNCSKSNFRCAKLVLSYPKKTRGCNHCQGCWVRVWIHMSMCYFRFFFLIHLQILTYLCHYGYWVYIDERKK